MKMWCVLGLYLKLLFGSGGALSAVTIIVIIACYMVGIYCVLFPKSLYEIRSHCRMKEQNIRILPAMSRECIILWTKNHCRDYSENSAEAFSSCRLKLSALIWIIKKQSPFKLKLVILSLVLAKYKKVSI